jgi:hypothetical protein
MSKLEGPLLQQLFDIFTNILSEQLSKECYKDKPIRIPTNFIENLVDLNKKKEEFRFFNYIIKKDDGDQWNVNEVVMNNNVLCNII